MSGLSTAHKNIHDCTLTSVRDLNVQQVHVRPPHFLDVIANILEMTWLTSRKWGGGFCWSTWKKFSVHMKELLTLTSAVDSQTSMDFLPPHTFESEAMSAVHLEVCSLSHGCFHFQVVIRKSMEDWLLHINVLSGLLPWRLMFSLDKQQRPFGLRKLPSR